MILVILFFLLLFAIAWGAAWLADTSGSLSLQWDVLGPQTISVPPLAAAIAIVVTLLVLLAILWLLKTILTSPKAFGRWRSGRKREKGYAALSRGLVAAGAGNDLVAGRMAKQAHSLLPDEPLTRMLEAQTALLRNRHDEARQQFEELTEHEETKLLGLRGLYLEAERLGEREAAAHYAEEANKVEPGTRWAVEALLRDQALHGEWSDALATLENNRGTGLFEREEFDRIKAVVLTAMAEGEEDAKPERARDHALAAHKLDKSLVPAATTYARACVRLGDMKKASKVLQETWSRMPHPDVAETYATLRPGDSVRDRLERTETLVGKTPTTDEGRLALARMALDAGDFTRVRDVMKPMLREQPTERACLLMADLEEEQHGDRGRVRDWLARALRAPRDKAWVADTIVSDEWKPVSPETGEIGAFEWKLPPEAKQGALAAPDGDYNALLEPLGSGEEPEDADDAEVIDIAASKPDTKAEPGPPTPRSPVVTETVPSAASASATTPGKDVPLSVKDAMEATEVRPVDGAGSDPVDARKGRPDDPGMRAG